ncbi:MAG TPA: hypothetical protein VFV08_03095 [Puia sp.]|nr:hypothetical protein [Puia sp.]
MSSLDSLSLPGLTIKELYGEQLVIPVQSSDKSKSEQALQGYPFMGNNAKKILLVVQSANADFLPDDDYAFISKMLTACKLNISDVAILNHHKSHLVMNELVRQFHPKFVLMFGIEPMSIKIPFTMPLFKIQAYDGCNYLYIPNMDSLRQDSEEGKLLKSKLWLCLQKLFPVA